MNKNIHSGDANRKRWAASLCFSSAALLTLQTIHPGTCAWLGMSDDESFYICAALTTLSVFMGTFIMTRRDNSARVVA